MSKSSGGSSSAAKAQAGIASALFSQTGPLRERVLADTLGAIDDPTSSNQFLNQKAILENQFNRASDNIIGSLAPGGGLDSSLGNLEVSRALGLSGLASDIEAQNRASGTALATNAAPVTISGLGSASQNLLNVRNFQAGQTQQIAQGVGDKLGRVATLGTGGKK